MPELFEREILVQAIENLNNQIGEGDIAAIREFESCYPVNQSDSIRLETIA